MSGGGAGGGTRQQWARAADFAGPFTQG